MRIASEKELKEAFNRFDGLVAKGLAGHPETEREARQLALAIQQYEDEHYPFPKPTTLTGMIELRMYERKLKQKDLADLLGVNTSRVSEILNGKRRISLEVAKRLRSKLQIDADFILEHA
ncbi:MAG: helix-turn-helix domain-containing protein [Ferruginibacter sp.]|nr:helix-turn-helix domain-containing protein [Cytophagales bacterium]